MKQQGQDRDIEFMSELQAATRLQPSFQSNMMLIAVLALIFLFVIWAAVSEVEEITRGEGQVMPSRQLQVVQSLEGGILSELYVSEGDFVKEGQLLLRINDLAFSSEERGKEAQLMGLMLKQARLQAEVEGVDFVPSEQMIAENADLVANELELYKSRQAELKSATEILEDKLTQAKSGLSETQAQINRLSQNRELLQEELELTERMVAQRAVPKLEEMRLRRELNDTVGNLNAARQKRNGLKAEIGATEKERDDQRNRFRTKALAELSDVKTQIKSYQEDLRTVGDRVDRAEVKSPVDGIVQRIALRTIGGVIEPAMRLIEIVPADDDMMIKAKVRPSDIAFLRPGLPVKVKISAYDPQIYGSLDGTLERISADSIKDREGNIFFEVEARTQKNYLGGKDNPLPISPGMQAGLEIITGERTILTYLMKPFLRARERAFTER